MSILSVSSVSKSFEHIQALKDIRFSMDEGEIVALLGPSGCGKSTLLAIIAGLEHPDRGTVTWNGMDLVDTPPHLRDFGLMFQDFALFPHMNVYANIAFGLKMAHLATDQLSQRVHEMLSLVGMPDSSRRDVNTLSGGEQQRIALARSLAPHPRLLMLDEPLGSLDRNLRERLVVDLQDILHRMHQTAIYVTHDQEEAFTIADRIILMNAGQIEQIGTPQEIYRDPASVFVSRFLEMTNLIPAVIYHREIPVAATPLGDFPVGPSTPGDATLLIRPDMARLDGQGPIILKGVSDSISFRGSQQKITLIVDHFTLVFEFPSLIQLPSPGTPVTISLDPATAIKVFPKY